MQSAYIVSARRSVVSPINGSLSLLRINELAAPVINNVIEASGINVDEVDELIVLDEAKLASPKTKDLVSKIKKLKLEDALFIDLKEFDKNFELAIKNIKGLELINIEGINVYDILRKEKLVLTKRSVEMLNERLQ